MEVTGEFWVEQELLEENRFPEIATHIDDSILKEALACPEPLPRALLNLRLLRGLIHPKRRAPKYRARTWYLRALLCGKEWSLLNEYAKQKRKEKIKFGIVSVISLCLFFHHLVRLHRRAAPQARLHPPQPRPGGGGLHRQLTRTAPDGATIFGHIAASLQVALTGYLLGALVGVPLGVAMAWFRRVDMFVTPLFDLIRPVPTHRLDSPDDPLVRHRPGGQGRHHLRLRLRPLRHHAYAGIKQTKPSTSGWPRPSGPPGRRCSSP